jgi:hypothetical protein
MPKSVFISYVREANDLFPREVHKYLKKRRVDVFLESEDALEGDLYKIIPEAIEDRSYFLIIISQSQISEWVLAEIDHAVLHHKRIIIVIAKNCETPEKLKRYAQIKYDPDNRSEALTKIGRACGAAERWSLFFQVWFFSVSLFNTFLSSPSLQGLAAITAILTFLGYANLPHIVKQFDAEITTLTPTTYIPSIPTSTNTATSTATFTPTDTPTNTATSTFTLSPTSAPQPIPSDTPTNTATNDPSHTPRPTDTPMSTWTPSEMPTSTPTVTLTLVPTITLTPTFTATLTDTPPPPIPTFDFDVTPEPWSQESFPIIFDNNLQAVSSLMLYAPVGCFDDGLTCVGHFWIDADEVDNEQYRLCVNADVNPCTVPANEIFQELYYDLAPAVNVDWFMAYEYCQRRNGRLPTEHEWLYAVTHLRHIDLQPYAHPNQPDIDPAPTYINPIWEWVDTTADEQQNPTDVQDNTPMMVLRVSDGALDRGALRAGYTAGQDVVGFRCVAKVE